MRKLASFVLSLAILAPSAAMASPASDALGSCMRDNTSGKERKDLARWVWVSMSTHPDIRGMAAISEPVRIETNKQMGELVTRLLAVNCPEQARAVGREGPQALMASFKSLGEVAMLELTSNPSVGESLTAYAQFLDRKKVGEVLNQ